MRRWLLLGAFCALVGFIGPNPVAETRGSQTELLVSGSSIRERTEVQRDHTYAIDLSAGDFLDVRVAQDEVLVSLTVRDPRNAVAHVAALPSTGPLPARLLYIASESGRHHLDVHSNGLDRERGVDRTFTLEVLALRPSTEDDAERVRIAALGDRAGALALEQKLTSLEESIPLFEEAAAGWRRLGEPEMEAVTLKAVAHITSYFTQFRETSAGAFRRLIVVLQMLQHVDEEADAWYRLGAEYMDDGQVARARDAAVEAARLARDRAMPDRYARHLWLAALAEARLGNYEDAQTLASQALETAVSAGDHTSEAQSLSVLAELQALSGDVSLALHLQERAVDALSKQPHSGPLRDELSTLGFLHLRAGDLDAAEHRFSASLALAKRSPFPDIDALTYIGLGDVAAARGDGARARTLYDDARARLLKSGHADFRCRVETRSARLLLVDGDHDAARALLDSALTIGRRIASPTCEADSRKVLVDLALATGTLEEAHAQAMRVVQLQDTFREATMSPDARSLGFASLAPAYERAVDITMQLARGDERSPRIAEGLVLNERALARGLLDALTSERLERAAHLPKALEAERRRLRETWRERVFQRERAQQRQAAERAAALGDEIAFLDARLRDVESRIDAANPRHAAFTRPPSLALDDIRALLGDDTALVEYALGDSRSYAWVVDATGVHAFTLASRVVIETAVRHAHAQLSRVPDGLSPPASEAVGRASLDEVARLVLNPFVSRLTKQRLVIVAPGALALLPFGVLPVPNKGNRAGQEPLLARHEILSVPSAAVLSALRSMDVRRSPPSRSIAVFADPIYEADDPRLASTGTASQTVDPRAEAVVVPRGWTRAADGTIGLARLPFSRREAAAIQRYAPTPPLSLVGLDATRERALASNLDDYRIVHFAAHGLLQPDIPNLSGIALSLVDARGRPRNGFLMLPDVYDLTLNADLVVLSACETALGNEIRGEGVLGLPRGFMYAGATRVVSSLWRVDDEATAVLMEAFYRRLLKQRLTPAAALRAAQLEMRATPRWRSPFFWAGFVLQGDWR